MGLHSRLGLTAESDFSFHNFPFSIFTGPSRPEKLICTALGDYIIDLAALYELNLLEDLEEIPGEVWLEGTVNSLAACGRPAMKKLREKLQFLFSDSSDNISNENLDQVIIPIAECKLHMPISVPNYTDFYSSEYHAANVGSMFRDPQNPLLPNWKHLPVAYHGRASSIFISGQDVVRPQGQIKPPTADLPVFSATKQLDYELEMAFVVGKGNNIGRPIPVSQAENHIFGLTLFNDWSARDIQSWEYVPLGPFLAKNFHSTMSPWIVTLDALEDCRIKGPEQVPAVLPYLQQNGPGHFNITMTIDIIPENSADPIRVSETNYKYLYWSIAQQLAHHTISGCNMQTGDLCASGTISGPDKNSLGSLLETTRRGQEPLSLKNGTERTFLQDGDMVVMKAFAQCNGYRIGFGECSARILPAII